MKKLIITSLFVTLFVSFAYTQAFNVGCPTIEQQQAAYNRSKAAQITVRDTSSQQLQCHYNQLATYYQQLDKDNQQKAKDAQQIAKDIQQIAEDKRLIALALSLAEREASIVECDVQHLIDLIPEIEDGTCSDERIIEEIRRHHNHSGGGDGTNPGDHGNEDGYLNPHN